MELSSIKTAAVNYCSVQSWKNRFPITIWLPKYSLNFLVSDLLAGLTVGLMVIPQSLAYASVAKLPIQYGLYSSYMGCFVYCILGGAKDVTIGPTAIMSLLVSSYGVQDPDHHTGIHNASYAILLGFICGVIQLVLGIFHLGTLTGFISASVVAGFTTASAITIAFGQVKHVLGIHFSSGSFAEDVYNTFKNIPQSNPWDALLGIITMVFLILLTLLQRETVGWERRGWRNASLPVKILWKVLWFIGTARNAIVVGCGMLIAFALESSGHEGAITVTGPIDSDGIPKLQLPNFNLPNVLGVFNIGIALVPIIGFFESIVIGKGFARQSNYRIEPNQELIAIGACNLAGSFVQGYPVTGSFSRTAVNFQSGVRTPAAGVVTGSVVLLALAYLTPLFRLIPEASLGAVIIVALIKLIQLPIMKKLWTIRKLDLVPYVVTLLASLGLDVAYGTLIGIGVDLIILLYPVARPDVKVESSPEFSSMEEGGLNSQQLQIDAQSITVITVESDIRYPSVEYLCEKTTELVLAKHPSKLVLDFSRVNTIDYTVVQGLSDLMADLRRYGVVAAFANVLPTIQDQLQKGEIQDLLLFDTVQDAVWNLAQNSEDGKYQTADDSSQVA
ncbi:sodium-independent sulfate anion transporter-like [Diadema setosum]|uniref:sodium-independent sulfate anion transporter-like n=1 Tax=Diadema setosum TaxID=31175 RepID=UPI003B3B6CC9